MGVLLTGKRPGIRNQPRPLALSWRWCDGTCGAISFFLHPVPTPTSFYCLVRRSHSWLMRCVTAPNVQSRAESLSFDSWLMRLAALEAVLGLLIQISCIATQRFFC